MYDNIYNMFPKSKDFPEMNRILGYAVSYAEVNKNNTPLTMEHILLGYMQVSSDNVSAFFKWYVDPKRYMKKMYINTGKFLANDIVADENNISADVEEFSIIYRRFMEYSHMRMDMRNLYYLITYLKCRNFFSNGFYLSHYPTDDKDYKKFCESYERLTTAEVKRSESKPSFNSSFYASPIRLNYVTDITNKAFHGEFDNLVGRESELELMTCTLTNMVKNNVVLIGNAGVGKTSIVRMLARNIVKGQVPNLLKGYYLLEFNKLSSVSGTRYRGDYEENINKLFEQLTKMDKKVILFIDDISHIVALGKSTEGTLSLSDMIIPFIDDSSRIKLIGTANYKEFKKIESDPNLGRLVQTIQIEEPSVEDTLRILSCRKSKFEKNFDLVIPDTTLEEVIKTSQQYIPERYLPDKAIYVLDNACSFKYNASSVFGDILTKEDVFTCISKLKDIPMEKIQNSFSFENIEDELNGKVIGQQRAVSAIAKAIRRTQAGLNDPNRPLASFMFVGPTGVGKTEIAKTLASTLFAGKDNFIRFDMSEFMEEHSISKLIGSPPGYVGYSEGGQLTDKVHNHPYSLVLFDEIEKAHPKTWNLLLQILDDGILTDSHGEKINFKNTIIILTSNTGIRETQKNHPGFGNRTSEKSKNVMSAVKQKFSPEFLNRLDEIIVFNELTEDNIFNISRLCISNEIISKLEARNISIHIDDEVIMQVAKHGYSAEYGARELKRTITRELKNPLADYIIAHPNLSEISISLSDTGNLAITSNELSFV